MDEVARLRAELSASHRHRGLLYALFYEALLDEIGAEAAERIMKRAIYARGSAIGERFKGFAPADMEGLCGAFLDFVPDQGRMFEPEVLRCDDTGIDIQFHRCPLKEAWQDAGLSDDRIATLCRIAGIVDDGTFEGAGFTFSAETWRPGRDGCCRLHIRPGPAAAPSA
jgi:hypothetical protein